MRFLRSFWVLAALALTACSLLVDFDAEGQPCDSQNQCLAGYVCENGSCVSGEAPPGGDGGLGGPDGGAGADAGPGAGREDAGPDAGADGGDGGR
ncbi:hypothetical protein [Stigmatella aurantiaca]|uniref:Conserved uncharacterized protein n=1 Tax=Stigmatella aurantiaca (strain DW4/3-1) TaxID=378806 RepID=Q098M5_STIAD|nr:hypothetical protein [Stigmatella aurantiaca]ADO74164.1 conserved uncharacterized protein [Stigmatella aurantiaca DW4/3-1]EAU68203.1 conserved hypothetical protein [Stigmatella aurantiaca DW4/3-1]